MDTESRGTGIVDVTIPFCDHAKQYSGYGTALKPATEFWTLARKPLIGTVAENVLKYGTGGLNIDACRIDYKTDADRKSTYKTFAEADNTKNVYGKYAKRTEATISPVAGRFPANVIFDEYMAAELDKQSGELTSRFFYVAKPDTVERNRGTKRLSQQPAGSYEFRQDGSLAVKRTPSRGNFHPTVKPVDLMRYLIRLITPKGGIVLDPFNGSGTTGVAAKLEFMNYIGIEREKEYCDISEARIAAVVPQAALFEAPAPITQPTTPKQQQLF